ncbi:uncharacterized protein CIMG_02189 [Coccidioides immitis RS]|uniref:Uncharacterized protein n=1 Tax=Coccidioides immitis (strain RS) TaxID=246410 RepID=A0A0E1RZ30_COCIM|nr:uncharacterized protein CIMG_02189 [Coccidioides immitis RS]EAS36835.2 hypothetical protein CIMG_02189 [Coccidioides immitis RS]
MSVVVASVRKRVSDSHSEIMISTGLRYIIAGEVWDLSSPWLDSLVLCKEIKTLVSLFAYVVPDGFIFTLASAITTQQVDGYREWDPSHNTRLFDGWLRLSAVKLYPAPPNIHEREIELVRHGLMTV